ncbi:Fanconi anemia group I protein-like [Oopsacas minuta]|uniref:Fanconi anemia group I protein-like n=1 Tax=Oopsacas minuta TaxID=111878 RepID=A0AAV7JUF8_9METZ|nr:Fanconi anemia group I protein-like [Oopsacas minuta]
MTSQIQHILLNPHPYDANRSRYALTIEQELNSLLTQDSISSNATGNELDNIVILIEDCINVMTNNNKFDPSLTSPVLSVLAEHIGGLSIQGVVNLTEYFVSIVKRGEMVQPHAFQLLTQLLTIVNDHDLTMGDLETMDIDTTHELTLLDSPETDEVKQSAIPTQVVNTICASPWHPSIVLPLTKALKNVQLTEQLFRVFIDKCMATLSRNEEPQNIPAVIKELITSLNSSRVSSFLAAIDLAYNNMELKIVGIATLCDLHESYGLILTYLSQNRIICQEILKLIKLVSSEEHTISKIEISTFIAMMGTQRYQLVISDSLYSLILKSYRDEDKLIQSKMLRIMSEIRESEKYDVILIDTVKKTNGWDSTVMQGFVKLGISLIYNSSSKLRENTLSTDPLAKTADLGVRIVSEIFKLHGGIREHILSSALEQIVTLTYNSGKMPYLNLLKTIISSSPQLVLDCTQRVTEALDYITALPLNIAYTFLDAIQPLIKYSLTLRDALLLKMRKALFMKSRSARCIGVYGFLSVLKKFKINIEGLLTLCSQRPISQPFSSSQILVDIRDRPAITPEANEGLCLEVLGILQRSLSQTSDVKQVLYNGFYDVICVNPQLDTPILEMLLSHLKSYIPRENRVGEAVQPAVFQLDMLFQFSGIDFIPTESLPSLITSVQLCYLKVVSRLSSSEIDTLDTEGILYQVKGCLDSLTQKMIDASLDDFELNINSDFTGVAVGKKNCFIARTLIGVYEALIEYSFLCDEITSQLSERILLLFLKCERILTLIKEKLLPARRSMVAQHKDNDMTSFTFTSLVHILTSLLSDNNPDHELALTDLRQNVTLVRHCFNAVILRLQELQTNGYILDSPWLYQEKTFKKAYQLGRVLLRHVYTPIIQSRSGAWKRDRGRALDQFVFEALSLLFIYIQKHMSQAKLKFLVNIRPDNTPQSADENNLEEIAKIVYLHLQGFQTILLGIFTQQHDRFTTKDALFILQICQILHSWLPIESTQIIEVYDWMHRFCSQQQLSDLVASSKLLENLFTLHLQLKSGVSFFRKIAEDIHLILGDVDNETEVDDELHYRIVTSRNVTPTVSTLFFNMLEKVLDETDWLITKLARPSNDETHESTYDMLSQRLLTLVATFHHIIQTSFPLGTVSDNLPKLCTKLYNTFIKAVKYHISLYHNCIGEMSEKFQKVISYTGTHLEQQMYIFISHYQSLESENGNFTKGKGKEKEKGKEKDGLFMRPTSISKTKIMKQARSYPNLIFALEQYERFLIQLSKKCKCNLLESFKTSTARDFRINTAAVDAALNEFDEIVDGTDSEHESDEEGNRSKRARTDEVMEESHPIE